ncbi:hypothetical protein KAR91_38955 [Candidatus Pacearchaeota archaeon]|nr:hypothetical protein [Candidatus Pacearchaeota archaeon]
MADRFEKAASLLPVIVDTAIEETEEQLLDLNRSQLIIGQKSDGQAITPRYTPAYAKRKKGSKSSPTPDLLVSGKFYKSFDAQVKKRTIEIEGTAKTSKGFDYSAHLEKRYSSEIYGLTEQNTAIYARELLPLIQKGITDVLQI